jgi:hypothetical protein
MNMQIKTLPRGRQLFAAIMIALAGPATAAAAHWSALGGEAGRSGNQPVSAGTPPVRALYSRAEIGDRSVQTSILTTAGAVGAQRFAYGTANGRVHLRMLASGAAVGPAGDLRIDDGVADADVFGLGPSAPEPASVGLVDTSTPGRLGQLLAVHNDDVQGARGDISIAQIDETTGTLVRQVPLEGTDGYSIRSSPVVTPADAAGRRVLFFVAENGDEQRLFRVPIADAASRSAGVGGVTSSRCRREHTREPDARLAARRQRPTEGVHRPRYRCAR